MTLQSWSQSEAGRFPRIPTIERSRWIWFRRCLVLFMINLDPRIEHDQMADLRWLMYLKERIERSVGDPDKELWYRFLYSEQLGACHINGIKPWQFRLLRWADSQ